MDKRVLALYSLCHFLVDFACAFLLIRYAAGTPGWYPAMLAYNFCAFALQMPLGVLADRLDRNAAVAAAGCGLVAAAYGVAALIPAAVFTLPVATAVVAGLGNALFHVGGGVETLNHSEKTAGPLGVFVSPGAFGIYFGRLLGRGGALPVPVVALSLPLAAAALLAGRYVFWRGAYKPNAPCSLAPSGGKASQALPALLCLFAVVCLRSYLGLTLRFPWQGAGQWGLLLLCALVLGKTAGGFLADALGAKAAGAASLGLASALFLLSALPGAGVAAVFLFNMSMPITLWAVARLLPGAKGFSFGLLTFGLFLGFVPVYLGLPDAFPAFWGYALAGAVSMVLLGAGLPRRRASA